ncbi:MAG: hypothetical protein KC413_25005, partial [Anaerolineales bacterium]|nr:hypothetical protein [Anaerolineales bacterium]
RQTTDGQGAVTLTWAYSPEGAVIFGEEGPVTHLGCEATYDWSTGLIFKNGSYFDPNTGIWITMGGLVVWSNWQPSPQRSRKQRRRRLLWLALLFLLLLLTLVGCGGEGTPTPIAMNPTATCMATAVTNPTLPPTYTPSFVPTRFPTSTPTPLIPTPTPTGSYLLDVSVQIVFYSSTTLLGERGIGTVVNSSRGVILTHNHYYTRRLSSDKVRILDANGIQLDAFNINEVKQEVYSDGILFLGLPPGRISFTQQAQLGDPNALNNGDAYQQVVKEKPVSTPPKLTVYNTTVADHDYGALGQRNSGIGHLLIDDPGLYVESGDSGGGGFVGNLLVANTWAVVEAYNPATNVTTRSPFTIASKHPPSGIVNTYIQRAAK